MTKARSNHFFIVTSEFPPEPGVSGRMSGDLAGHLVAEGYQATVVCPYPSRPSGAIYPNSGGGTVTEETFRGARVIRVPSKISPQSRFGPRMQESWSFGRWSSKVLSEQKPAPDVVYSVTWPMLGQAWIGASSARLAIPHVTHIMDLYPESAWLKVPRLVRWATSWPLLSLDRWNALNACRVLVISDNMRQAYVASRKIPQERVTVLPTWQDESLFLRLPLRSEAAKVYGVREDHLTFFYLGNIGPVAGVDHLIHSFGQAGLENSQLLIVGEGTEKAACVQLANHYRQAQIRFLSDPKIDNVPLLQSLADICLLPVRQGAALSSIPSKLSSYMLSAKPVLASVDSESETAQVIRAADCGWIVEPENQKALRAQIQSLARCQRAELVETGLRGRSYALEHLSRSRGVRRLAAVLLEANATTAQSPERAPLSNPRQPLETQA